MEAQRMSELVDDLLKTYYGFGDGDEQDKSFLTHNGTTDRYDIFAKSVSTNCIIDVTEENLLSEESNTQANDTAADQAGNDSEEILIRPSRAIIDDDDADEENVWMNDRELILDSKEIQKDIIPDDTKIGINVVTSSDKGGTRDEPAASQASLGILEVLVQDNVSEISSSLAPKKKLKNKSRTTASAPSISTQLPSVRFQTPVRKTPTYNGEFFDMSDAHITEFPTNLLDGIQGIKMLYLENNALTNLPDEIFTNLKFLEWFDVRHNKLTSIPATIKHHPSLETILLQGNQFERLPLELGVIPHLKGLQVQDNPLVYPPSNILSLGFTAIMNFLRKQWNADHPDEIVNSPKEVKSELTILCHDPPSVQSTSRTTKMHTDSSSIILPKLHKNNLSIREKSWNYKPSNRYGMLNAPEYNAPRINSRRNNLENISDDSLCDNCYNQREQANSANYTNDNPIPYQQIKVKLREKENIAKEYSETSQMSISTKKDAGVLVKLETNNCKKPNTNVKLPRIRKITLAEEIKRMEDVKVKERVYSVITNDRKMTKLRPMRLKDPDWTLAFIENYLDIANRPVEYSSPKCNGSGMNAILEAKLQWISKVKEKLNKQAAILQRIKDRDALKKWRQDRRSFVKSIKKAANRTSKDIPFGVDYTDIPFLSTQELQKEKPINSPKKDVNAKMSEISMSLAQLQTDKQSGKLEPATELKRLQEEIEKLSNLQRQIHDLKTLNQTSMSKYNDVDSGQSKIKYKPPPSIII